jgi:chromosome segregation protein
MYLKSLEINGFKSFAKKGVLEFTSPISSIVGPNGSGKSNVAESFRFVLGEQSIKSMRGKKGEDLIFNGSDAAGRLNRAMVKLVFDNSKRILPLDFEEVSIERHVGRDGVNEYFINGSAVRLRDVQELLSHAHIGASGHHIISQGEADRILSANLKERRSMIEDALGLKVFQYKKIESERKLEKTEENVKQVESLRRELAPHLKFLKKQVEKVEKAIQLKEELRNKFKEYLKREDLYIKESKEKIQKDVEAPQSEVKNLDIKLEDIKKKLALAGTENEHKLALIEAENKIQKAREEKQAMFHSMGRLEGEIASIKKIIEREEKKAEEANDTTVYIREVEGLLSETQSMIEIARTTGSFDQLIQACDGVSSKFKEFIQARKVSGSVHNSNEYVEDIAKLDRENKEFKEKCAVVEQAEKSIAEEIKRLNLLIEETSKGNRDAEREMYAVMAERSELQVIVNALHAKKHELSLEEDNWKRELGEACVLIDRDMANYESIVITGDILGEDRTIQQNRRREVEKMKIRLEELGAGSSDEVMKEYRETEERDVFLARELTDLENAGQALRNLIKELEEKINTEFKAGISKINLEFQKYFELLFGGGKASLQIVREEKRKKKDDFDLSENMDETASAEEATAVEEGIDISVDLPKKKVKALMMLSGGERALTSIALLFAMSQVNPPPFIILDETDAALDEANSRKYGDMIENLAKYSQLIVITHNRETMSRAGVLYGVTMIQGASKLLSIKFDEAVRVAK